MAWTTKQRAAKSKQMQDYHAAKRARIQDEYDDLPTEKRVTVKVEGSLEATLVQRGERYGPFSGHADTTIRLKTVIRSELEARQKALANDQLEALDMICHKIGRIVNGDPDYDDSWIDIAGYAQLVAKRLQQEQAHA